MQELTSSICKNNVAQGEEGLLRDTRDDKVYWVSKLRDNNCWMTQNLDFDGPSGNGALSDFANNSSLNAYYEAGDYIWAKAGSWSNCANNTAGLSDCVDNGWTLKSNLINSTWNITYSELFIQATSYVGTDGQTICSKTVGSYLGDVTSIYLPCRVYSYKYEQYMMHYHVGNYYTYQAVTNSTAPSNSGTATGSICPNGITSTESKDWKLPIGNSTSSGSFGTNNVSTGASLTGSYGIGNSNSAVKGLISSPLYFIPGGYIQSGYLQNAGSQGLYWSSTAVDSANAYALFFSSGGVGASNSLNRYRGQSVRCLVLGS